MQLKCLSKTELKTQYDQIIITLNSGIITLDLRTEQISKIFEKFKNFFLKVW